MRWALFGFGFTVVLWLGVVVDVVVEDWVEEEVDVEDSVEEEVVVVVEDELEEEVGSVVEWWCWLSVAFVEVRSSVLETESDSKLPSVDLESS